MNNTALTLVVTGAILHAVWNLFAKKASGGLPFVWLYGFVSSLIALPFGFVAWHNYGQPLSVLAWVAIAASALLHVLYSLVLQKGYRASDFSVVYPLARGTGPMFAVFGAVLLLGETPTGAGWLGIAAVLIGILLVSGMARLTRNHPASVQTGVFWGSLTGLCIAAYTVVDGWAIKMLHLPPVLYYVLGLGLRTAVLAPQALHDRTALHNQWRRNRPYILIVGVLSPLAYSLVLFSVSVAPLSYVAPVRELSMMLGVLMGAYLLRERLQASRVFGTALMVAGIILLARTH